MSKLLLTAGLCILGSAGCSAANLEAPDLGDAETTHVESSNEALTSAGRKFNWQITSYDIKRESDYARTNLNCAVPGIPQGGIYCFPRAFLSQVRLQGTGKPRREVYQQRGYIHYDAASGNYSFLGLGANGKPIAPRGSGGRPLKQLQSIAVDYLQIPVAANQAEATRYLFIDALCKWFTADDTCPACSGQNHVDVFSGISDGSAINLQSSVYLSTQKPVNASGQFDPYKPPPDYACGNHKCDPCENSTTCPQDCGTSGGGGGGGGSGPSYGGRCGDPCDGSHRCSGGLSCDASNTCIDLLAPQGSICPDSER